MSLSRMNLMSEKYIFPNFSSHFCSLSNKISNQLNQVSYPLEFLTFPYTLEALSFHIGYLS